MGLIVSEKKIFFFFFHYKSMGANVPCKVANLAPGGMVGRMNVEDHQTLLHNKSVSSGPHGFREEDF